MTTRFDEKFWDDRYRAEEMTWSGSPNPVLVSEVSSLPVGRALDVGSGEGADAIWLARSGWSVTATDISTVALERAASRAVEFANLITWQHHDFMDWVPPATSFDLVSSQFMHLPKKYGRRLFDGLATAVAPGGTLLIVGHQSNGHFDPDFFYTGEGLAAGLDVSEWDVLVAGARRRAESDDRHGHHIDEVLRARRH